MHVAHGEAAMRAFVAHLNHPDAAAANLKRQQDDVVHTCRVNQQGQAHFFGKWLIRQIVGKPVGVPFPDVALNAVFGNRNGIAADDLNRQTVKRRLCDQCLLVFVVDQHAAHIRAEQTRHPLGHGGENRVGVVFALAANFLQAGEVFDTA